MLNDSSLSSQKNADFNPIKVNGSADLGFDTLMTGISANETVITSDGLAHDINNLLHVMQNTLELAWPAPKSQTERKALDTIRLAISKARGLAFDIMDASSTCRIANRIPTSPADLVTAFEPLLRGIATKNIKLNFRLRRDIPNVKIDRDHFCKILINLVKNASEAFAGKLGEVTVDTASEALSRDSAHAYSFCGCQPEPGDGTVFTVEDNGPGVSAEFLDTIMMKSFTTKKSGHGLGLANVVELVKFNHGGIRIETSPGKGFKFHIWIPATYEAVIPVSINYDETSGEAAETRPEGDAVGIRPCVLMLDDDPAILQSSALLLRSMKTDAILVDNTEEALKVFNERKSEIDIVFLDANVGKTSTLPLLERFRQLAPHIPCVIVSGYAESKIRGIFNSALYDGFLGKPYTRADILSFITRFSNPSPL